VPGQSISQDIFGLEVKLAGDAVFDQNRWMPQVAFGLEDKRNDDMTVPRALGSRHDEDVDFYFAATKVWLGAVSGSNVLLNGTARATKANPMGLLGFGGNRPDECRYMPEASVGIFLTDSLILGAEARRRPDNLSVFREETFKDVFVTWFPSKRVSLTAAWLDLGWIADRKEQRAFHVSGQLAFRAFAPSAGNREPWQAG